ncbi:MAG: hypothetical protein ABI432_08765 [Flavobacteriales bacterium]
MASGISSDASLSGGSAGRRVKVRNSAGILLDHLRQCACVGTGPDTSTFAAQSHPTRTILSTLALSLTLVTSAQNYTDLIEVMRADVRTERQAIVRTNMGLNDAKSALFSPIYDEYTAEMKKHWDKRIALIKDYAGKYEVMDDATAKSLMDRSTALEKENLAIRTKYAKKMTKVLPATDAARWMQIERRLGEMIDLQIANELPIMPVK